MKLSSSRIVIPSATEESLLYPLKNSLDIPMHETPYFQGNTDSIVVRFHSWIFIQSKESSDANSELFKEDNDEAMHKNPYEI